jgi:hypothetical protein
MDALTVGHIETATEPTVDGADGGDHRRTWHTASRADESRALCGFAPLNGLTADIPDNHPDVCSTCVALQRSGLR